MNDDPFNDPIIVQETRILRPSEYKQFLRGIPKNDFKTMFNALLCSGMRYQEFVLFAEYPKWFNESEQKIYLPKIAVRKKKIKRKQRWIQLSDFGAQQIANFQNIKREMPSRRTWYENLQRWAENSDMSLDGINIKLTRKTWECWLLEYYKDYIVQVLLSQGHTKETAINHYLSLPFTKQHHQEMAFMMEGWMKND